jgi:caffeoyl-CoA O-methyltransferase
MDCKAIESFLEGFIKYPHPLLKELYEDAKRENFPVVEPIVGHLIMFFVKLLDAKIIVEFGSGFGYSALWAAFSCKDCKIYCIDYQEKNRRRALQIFRELNVEEKIEYLVGEAETIFNRLNFPNNSIDLVLFDHEKQNYSESLDLVLPKLKKGGVIIADDVLWKGNVLNPEVENIREKSLRFFLKESFTRKEIQSCLYPFGDGVLVIQKL